ncbi:MAG: SPOR domain-containing protein [Desulfovibrionaceae bacterium]
MKGMKITQRPEGHQVAPLLAVAALVLMAPPLLLAGCIQKQVLAESLFPEAVRHEPQTTFEAPANANASSRQSVQNSKARSAKDVASGMYYKVLIDTNGTVPKEETQQATWTCLLKLAATFGEPFYTGNVVLRITAKPGDNGRMNWSLDNFKERTISLHHFNLLPEQQHILAHELFHAFYESDAFIRANPDIILEGLAVFAEYIFRYDNLDIMQLRNKISRDVLSLDSKADTRNIDMDQPFEAYSSYDKDLIYLLAGQMIFYEFASNKEYKELIRTLLGRGGEYPSKQHFVDLALSYGFKNNAPFVKRAVNIGFQLTELPEPIAISQDGGHPAGYPQDSPPVDKQFLPEAVPSVQQLRPGYYVQIMATQNVHRLDEYKEMLCKQEISAQVIPGNGFMWRLMTGPYKTAREAETMKNNIAEKYSLVFHDSFIVHLYE